MKALDESLGTVHAAVDAVASSLVSVNHWPDCSFVNLPMIYPSGDSVTVRISAAKGGFRVSDNGFAYREAEAFGNEDSFARIAKQIIDQSNLEKNSRAIYLDVAPDFLYVAVCEVARATLRAAEKLTLDVDEEEITESAEILTERLKSIFGFHEVTVKPKITGASTNIWPMTAMVKHNGSVAAFQFVGGSTYSIYRASSAFNDLVDLERPPALVAVVPSREVLGKRLNLLSRSARVLEQGQPEQDYIRAAV